VPTHSSAGKRACPDAYDTAAVFLFRLNFFLLLFGLEWTAALTRAGGAELDMGYIALLVLFYSSKSERGGQQSIQVQTGANKS